MRILLIDPEGWQKGGVNLGLLYLASMILKNNHEVRILDLNNYFYELERFINVFQPHLIGYSVRTATVKSVEEISRQLKEQFPHIIQIAGGPHITICFKEFLKQNPQIDFSFLGESEISFVQFINMFGEGKDYLKEVRGLVYKKNGELAWSKPIICDDLDELPFPNLSTVVSLDYSLLPYPLLTSRGCPYGCIFCCVGLVSSRKWRARSVENIIKELRQAKQRYGFSRFEILDDNFTFDLERAKEICRQIIKQRLNLTWYCHNGIRADRLDLELVQLMKEAGCESCALGIETGDPELFRGMNKGESLEDIVRAVGLLKKVGIKTVGYFIIGLPGDNLEKTKKTIEFQDSLDLDDFMYNTLIPYPGTNVWEYVKHNGRFLMDIRDLHHFSEEVEIPFETADFTSSERKKAHELAMHQTEFEVSKLKNYLANKDKKDVKRILLTSFDKIIYRIIKKAYPEAELVVVSNQRDIFAARLLTEDDKRITFINDSILKDIFWLGRKKEGQKFDFALLPLKGLLNLNKTIALMFKSIDMIIIYRSSASSFKPFLHLALLKKFLLSLFLLFNIVAWVIAQTLLLITVAFIRIRRLRR